MAKRRVAPAPRESTRSKPAAARQRAAARPSFSWQQALRNQPGTCAILLAALHVMLAFLFFEPQMHSGGDNAAYLALAESLLSGRGYREIYDPAVPLHTQYPPVFPLLLAGLLALGFRPWIPFKVLVVICSTAAIVLSYYWMRRRLRPELAFTAALLMAVSPGVLGLSHWELSDVPFWTFTMAALLAWERLGPRNTKRLAAASVLTLIAYFTRSAGLPLLVAAVAWLGWKRRWRQLVIFAAVMAPFVIWWWWRARTQGGVDYVQQFWWINPYAPELGNVGAVDLLKRALANGSDYLTRHLPLLLIGNDNKIGVALAGLVLVLALAGWIRRLRHAQVAELFLPLYIGLLLAWPAVWSGERFLVPALPLLLFYAAETLQRVVRHFWPARVRLIGYATAGIIVALCGPALVLGARWGTTCMRLYSQGDPWACHTEETRDFFQIAELAGRTLPDSAIVLSRKPRVFWAVSGGKQGRIYPLSAEPDSLFNAARNAGARFVVLDRLDRLSQAYLMPVLARRAAGFCMFYSYGPNRSAILGIKPNAAAAPDNPNSADQAIRFEVCGAEYWKNAAMREAILGPGR